MRRALLLLTALSGCAPMPELPLAPADRAPSPALASLEGLLAQGDALTGLATPGPGLASEAEALTGRAEAIPAAAQSADGARAAALAARAAVLRAPVLAPEDRARLAGERTGRPSLQ